MYCTHAGVLGVGLSSRPTPHGVFLITSRCFAFGVLVPSLRIELVCLSRFFAFIRLCSTPVLSPPGVCLIIPWGSTVFDLALIVFHTQRGITYGFPFLSRACASFFFEVLSSRVNRIAWPEVLSNSGQGHCLLDKTGSFVAVLQSPSGVLHRGFHSGCLENLIRVSFTEDCVSALCQGFFLSPYGIHSYLRFRHLLAVSRVIAGGHADFSRFGALLTSP